MKIKFRKNIPYLENLIIKRTQLNPHVLTMIKLCKVFSSTFTNSTFHSLISSCVVIDWSLPLFFLCFFAWSLQNSITLAKVVLQRHWARAKGHLYPRHRSCPWGPWGSVTQIPYSCWLLKNLSIQALSLYHVVMRHVQGLLGNTL